MKNFLIAFFFFAIQLNSDSQDINARNEIPVGEIIQFESTILDKTRDIFLYQPKGFWGMDDSMTNLPVIIVLDGEYQFLHTVATVDFLSSAPLGNDKIPRSIVVGIPNTNRNRDLSPVKGMIANDSTTLETTGGGKKFLSFITDELIPFIDTNYSTSQHRTIIGHSMGGLITFEALLRKRTYFKNYISIDPALGFANETYLSEIMDTLTQVDLSNKNLFFATANTRPTFLKKEDAMKDDSDFMKMISIPNKKFLTQIDRNICSLNISSKHYENENHFSVPQQSTIDALRQFYHFYAFPEIMNYYHPSYKNKTDLIEQLRDHYQMISEKMGYKATPMEGYINSFAFGIAPSGREDLAIALFEYNIELHPENPTVYNNLGYFYLSKGKNREALKVFQKSIKINSDQSVLETIESLEN